MHKGKFMIVLFMIAALFQSAFAITGEVVRTDPAPVVAGEYADVTLRFDNKDVDNRNLEDLEFRVGESPYFKQISPTKETLSRFFANEEFTATFRVYFSEELEQGNVILPLEVIHSNGKNEVEVEIYVEENEEKPQLYVGNIETTPSELLPDTDNNDLVVTLQNLGDKDAELLSAELVPKTDLIVEAYAYSLRDNVASVAGGEEAELEFTIDVEEGAQGVLDAVLKVNYRAEEAVGNSYVTYTEEIPVTIPITGAPFLHIKSVEQLDDFNAGTTENRIRVIIENVGVEEAEDVRVRLQPDISYPFIFERTSEYVGASIKPGEEATIEFQAEVTQDAEIRGYATRVLLESMVQETRYEQDDELTIEVNEELKRTNNDVGKILIMLVIVVSAGFGVVRFLSRRKRAKKN